MLWQKKLQDDLSSIDRLVRPRSMQSRVALNGLDLMVLSLEDRRFFHHFGVDPRSVAREVMKLMKGKKYGGASTIDMQFVRTATGYRAQTFKRKLYEVLLAIVIQFRYDKTEILESYLACAHFGFGLTGAETTARKLFGKALNQLELTEAALMSAMLARPRPSRASLVWQRRIETRAAYAIEVYMSGKLRLPRQMRTALTVFSSLPPGEQRKLEFPVIV
jgi:membrane carboxypeptidase/penicillin-binding protein PbpC